MRWLIALLPALALAQNEPYWSERWCDRVGGEAEVVMDSGHRVDCIVGGYVVEAGFAKHYRADIGQALDYGEQTGSRPGLLLLVKDTKDREGAGRARAIIREYRLPIRVWQMEVAE